MTEKEMLALMQEAIKPMIADAIAPLNERFDRMDERFDRMDERFNEMDCRMNTMDEKLNAIKEDTEITRSVTNELVGWAEKAGEVIDVPFPQK